MRMSNIECIRNEEKVYISKIMGVKIICRNGIRVREEKRLT